MVSMEKCVKISDNGGIFDNNRDFGNYSQLRRYSTHSVYLPRGGGIRAKFLQSSKLRHCPPQKKYLINLTNLNALGFIITVNRVYR